jgi:hypothetical protein
MTPLNGYCICLSGMFCGEAAKHTRQTMFHLSALHVVQHVCVESFGMLSLYILHE